MASESIINTDQDKLIETMRRCYKSINKLGQHTEVIYFHLTRVQSLFDRICNIPIDKRLEYEKLVEVRFAWKKLVDAIENDYRTTQRKKKAFGAGEIGPGVAVAEPSSSVAMGVATSIGVPHTGTSVATLGGAIASKAALAMLGGEALAAGRAFILMAGPVGWAIAGVAFVGRMMLLERTTKKDYRLEEIFTLINIRDAQKYDFATLELDDRIRRIIKESSLLKEAYDKIKAFGTDYRSMTEEQQHTLDAYVKLMGASTQLLVNPILGLQPKYTKADLERFVSDHTMLYTKDDIENKIGDNRYWDLGGAIKDYPDAMVSLANLLYKISIRVDDVNILYNVIRTNDEFLKQLNLNKEQFSESMLYRVRDLLSHQYENKWTVCGNINGGSWENDICMINMAPGVWESEPVRIDGEFKLRFNNSWDDSRGGCCISEDVAFKAVKDAGNIVPPTIGHVYVVRYDTGEEEITLHDLSA